MAASKGNNNAKGNSGGKSLNDRKLAAEVRTLALDKIKDILEMPIVKMETRDLDLHDSILLRLSGSILPRLTEITGEDGGAILLKATEKNLRILAGGKD